MRSFVAVVVLALGACKGSPSPPSSGSASGDSKPAERAAPAAGAAVEATQVATEVRGAMTELAAYTERIYTILREAKDCDLAAKQLEELAPAFQTIGPRMLKTKERLMALPQADRDRIKQESDDLILAMKKRFADADAIEQRGKDCEKSSAVFAAVAPKVMFVKKH